MAKVKRVLSAALALVMAASAMPMVFAEDGSAAPTGPVDTAVWSEDCTFNEAWNGGGGRWADAADGFDGTGGYVSFRMQYQQFIFVQTEPDQHFRFSVEVGAARNTASNYGYVWETSEISDQFQLLSPIGKESHVTVPDPGIGYIPATGWDSETLTVDFTGDGAATYSYDMNTKTGAAFRVYYDSSWTELSHPGNKFTANIPFKVVVIDKVPLINTIKEAEKLNQNDYPASSWNLFKSALDAAIVVRDDNAKTQAEVDAALNTLQDAMDMLENSQIGVEKSALKKAAADARAKLDEGKAGDWYLDDAVANLNTKLERADTLVNYGQAADMPEIVALTEELIQLTADLDNQLKPADFSGLKAALDSAAPYLTDPDLDKKYEQVGIDNLKSANARAEKVYTDQEGKTRKNDQSKIDVAAQTLDTAVKSMPNYLKDNSITNVEIVPMNSADEVSGEVIYHKTPWYKTWTSQTVELTVRTNNNEAIKEIYWEPANWSVDDPEANIEGVDGKYDQTAVVRPTFGVGPRSFWIQAKVVDVNGGTTYSRPVKVRFYNYDWWK